jgi:site-specific DNA recombinase
MGKTAVRKASRVVGYIRVSTEKQADSGLSLDAQRAKLTAYATALDLTLVAIVVDAGESAKTLDRPGLARVLAMLDAGEADGVLVAKLDRLTRSVRDLADLIERYFSERPTVRACTLLSVADSIDTRTAAGRLVLNVLASVGQWEREVISERTTEALDVLKARGVKLGRPVRVFDVVEASRQLAEGSTQAATARAMGVSVPTLVARLARRAA